LALFQPHRFSRTKALCHKFGGAFDHADRVVVTDVYPASETPIPGISGETIADEIARHGHRGVSYQPRFEWVHRDIGNMLASGDLILSMGAGNIHEQLSILAADLVIAVGSNEITAGVGAKLKGVAYAAEAAGIGGLEWMEGIPGVVGGGLRMNAGAMGAQTFENVVRVSYLDAEGNPHTKTRDELEVHYRSFPLFENNFALSAVFRSQPSPAEQIARKLHSSQEKRRTSQPITKSAGC